MDSRTRVLQAMRRHGRPDRPPFEISWGAFTPSLMEVYRRGDRLHSASRGVFRLRHPKRRAESHANGDRFRAILSHPIAVQRDLRRMGLRKRARLVRAFRRVKYHPLQSCKTPAEIVVSLAGLTAEYRYEGLAERVAEYQRRGYAVTGELYQTIFERAWLMRGMEQLLIDFLAEPEMGQAICRASPNCGSSRPGDWPRWALTCSAWATTYARKKG